MEDLRRHFVQAWFGTTRGEVDNILTKEPWTQLWNGARLFSQTRRDGLISGEADHPARMRLAVVVDGKLEAGPAANAAAIVAAGLGEGFASPVEDADGNLHSAILWNLVVLKANTSTRLVRLLQDARAQSLKAVAFTTRGRELSNSFPVYQTELEAARTIDLGVVAVAVYGPEERVRQVTRSFSLF